MTITTNATGVSLIKESEGLRLTAYPDPSGAWTIGFGHTIGVSAGMVITEAQANQLLAQDLACFEIGVAALAAIPSSNEFSAMVSLAFNIGISGFKGSTVLREHNAGHKDKAGDAFRLWNKAHVDGQLVELKGLTTRREAERILYLTADAPPAPEPVPIPPDATYTASGSIEVKDGKPVSMTLTFSSLAALTVSAVALTCCSSPLQEISAPPQRQESIITDEARAPEVTTAYGFSFDGTSFRLVPGPLGPLAVPLLGGRR